MKHIASVVFGLLLIPNVSFAAGLTADQSSAILSILSAFGVEQAVVDEVQAILEPAVAAEAQASNEEPILGVAEAEPKGSLAITGNDNLFFQVSLSGYSAGTSFVVVPPTGWELYHQADECSTDGVCNSYRFLRHPEWRTQSAGNNNLFTVTMTVDGTEYTEQLRRGEERVVFD